MPRLGVKRWSVWYVACQTCPWRACSAFPKLKVDGRVVSMSVSVSVSYGYGRYIDLCDTIRCVGMVYVHRTQGTIFPRCSGRRDSSRAILARSDESIEKRARDVELIRQSSVWRVGRVWIWNGVPYS